jgi:hypothetical protein
MFARVSIGFVVVRLFIAFCNLVSEGGPIYSFHPYVPFVFIMLSQINFYSASVIYYFARKTAGFSSGSV